MPRSDTEELNYEDDIRIDKHRLDREFVTHPKKHMKYARLAAQATAALTRAEENVKIIRSEIITELLAKGTKPTGQVIEATYRTDERHKEAKDEWIEAQETASILNEAVIAFRHRKNSLENLAQLHVSGYFSSPKAPEGSNVGSSESIQKGAKDKVKKKLDSRKGGSDNG
jgi:hypothetical protein